MSSEKQPIKDTGQSGHYPEPVAGLLAIGDPGAAGADVRVAALGLAQEHVPDLVRMAVDPELNEAPSDSPQVWAPYHAMQALKELDASAFVVDLMPLVELDDDDWIREELPELFGRVGRPALAPLQSYLTDHARSEWTQGLAARALGEVGLQHPELHAEVVAILGEVLRDAERYDELVCTYAMDALVEMEAAEALPLIRRGFELDKVDPMMRGDWGEILDQLGVDPEPGDPLLVLSRQRAEERRERFFPSDLRRQLGEAFGGEPGTALERMIRAVAPADVAKPPAAPQQPADEQSRRERQRRAQAQARKEKQKRKASSAARKANKKKRK
jgi:hypothetical protein